MLNILMKLNTFLYKWYKLSTLKLDKNYLRNNYEYVFIRLEVGGLQDKGISVKSFICLHALNSTIMPLSIL